MIISRKKFDRAIAEARKDAAEEQRCREEKYRDLAEKTERAFADLERRIETLEKVAQVDRQLLFRRFG